MRGGDRGEGVGGVPVGGAEDSVRKGSERGERGRERGKDRGREGGGGGQRKRERKRERVLEGKKREPRRSRRKWGGKERVAHIVLSFTPRCALSLSTRLAISCTSAAVG